MDVAGAALSGVFIFVALLVVLGAWARREARRTDRAVADTMSYVAKLRAAKTPEDLAAADAWYAQRRQDICH